MGRLGLNRRLVIYLSVEEWPARGDELPGAACIFLRERSDRCWQLPSTDAECTNESKAGLGISYHCLCSVSLPWTDGVCSSCPRVVVGSCDLKEIALSLCILILSSGEWRQHNKYLGITVKGDV